MQKGFNKLEKKRKKKRLNFKLPQLLVLGLPPGAAAGTCTLGEMRRKRRRKRMQPESLASAWPGGLGHQF